MNQRHVILAPWSSVLRYVAACDKTSQCVALCCSMFLKLYASPIFICLLHSCAMISMLNLQYVVV